jgi:hypothetical protein
MQDLCTAWTCKCGAPYGSAELAEELFWATASGIAGIGSCACPSDQEEIQSETNTPVGKKYRCCDPSKFSAKGV